jgi:hypothetical protein
MNKSNLVEDEGVELRRNRKPRVVPLEAEEDANKPDLDLDEGHEQQNMERLAKSK